MVQGGVFSGQAKGIPTHGLQHIKALHTVAACQHIANGVIAHMAHVQLARWVGKHGEAKVFGAGLVFTRLVGAVMSPFSLQARFDFGGVVW